MKARIPKEYRDLTSRQKEKLKSYLIDVATEAAQERDGHNCRLILDIYMKMMCCVLHDAFGFGEKRLNCFIGNHKRFFTMQRRLVDKGEQLEYLDKRMAEIFKKNGFPQEFMDNLLGSGTEIIMDSPPKEE